MRNFEMNESLRIFGILLYKSWMIRTKKWIKFICEILIPLGEILFICSLITGPSQTPVEVKFDRFYEKESLDRLLYYVATWIDTYYAPKNAFTNELMANVKTCFRYGMSSKGFESEDEFNAFFRRQTILYYRPYALIFDKSVGRSTKYLTYKLRYLGDAGELGKAKPLYNGEATVDQYQSKLYQHYVLKNHLAQIQICVDRSFINLKSGRKPIPKMHIQQVPYPAKIKQIPIPFDNDRRMWFRFALMISSIFPLAIEIPRVIAEKFSGINVLMSMYGISNALNLLSWITSGILYLGILFYLPIVIYFVHTRGNTLSFLHYGNPFLVYFVLIFYLAHLLTFGIHVSAYFSRALLITIALIILISVNIYLQMYGFSESTLFLAPYVGIIFPGILFDLAITEINAYEIKAEGIHWYNLFTNTNPATKVGGSVGMILLLAMIGSIFHFLLAVYVYAVKPGKYGVAKHPLYFMNYQRKRNNDNIIESVDNEEQNDEYIEPVSEGVYIPGIQIRNLKKDYNISLFSEEKVHALRGVSIDFYKGQMTSLLGHNGAGKTTLMSILTGVTSPTEGTVIIDSKNLETNSPEIIKDMGLCTQENMYFSSLSVSEQLLFFTMIKKKDQSQTSRRRDVEDLLLKLKFHDKKDAMPDTLSGGQKRRLCLGMALAGDANTLILDEPTSGLDPESRRIIWDILLKMRGQKTILISTHDMEEAEILGDRIAIMHTGQLKSYGTSLFLKRLIGQNYVEIHLSIEPRSDPERIRSEISKEAIIVKKEANKMVVKIPNSPGLPDILDNLEKRKKELGVTGFSVSLISLEQVFIKMTEENDDPLTQQTNDDETKLTGSELYMQTVRALVSKKWTYTLKDYPIILIKLFTTFVGLLLTAMYLKTVNELVNIIKDPETLPINLKMYHRPEILYLSHDKRLGDRYKAVSRNSGGNLFEVTNTELQSALLKHANDDPIVYNNHLIAAAELNESSVNALFSETATYSLPISINLVSNTILKNLLGSDYSITMSYQALPLERSLVASDSVGLIKSVFVYEFCLTVAMFVVHPSKEFTSKIKHLQRMTGVSSFTYWSIIFLFDLLEYGLLVLLIIIGFVWIDLSLGLRLYGPTEAMMELLLFMLFGISMLPFIYIFSFQSKKTSDVLTRVISLTTSSVALDLFVNSLGLMFRDDETIQSVRSVFKWILQLIPSVSFSHCQMSFFRTVETNARCHRLTNDYYDKWCSDSNEDICCNLDCYDGKCKKSVSFFDDTDKDINLAESLIYLCVTAVLYFGWLAKNESWFCAKAMAIKHNDPIEINPDEQVQQEKSMVFERIEILRGNKPSSIGDGTTSNEEAQVTETDDKMFLVYELKKYYKEVKAVRDVSFSVNRRECFVLLGVNGAGKSTTFRMMTGEEVPNHGIMYVEDKEFEKNFKYCLSQIGYCPQQDAILKRLNAYEHLRLFARLRGIPKKDVDNEVQAWIDRLNLNAYALQPSGSYSGGNKRRLNIGIALIGNPNLIMMDEPTTGVDPGARRSLWNVVKACQVAGQSVVLTSHSMVECEALCDRLAIMVDGKLVCIGASEQLKQRFGAGYDIQIKMNPERTTGELNSIKNDMAESLKCVLTDENLIYLKYHVEPAGTSWRKMHDVMNGIKKKYDCIDDFLVSSSSLEQLFLMFAKSASSSSSSSGSIN